MKNNWPGEVFLWSGGFREEIINAVGSLAQVLGKGQKINLRDLAYTRISPPKPSPTMGGGKGGPTDVRLAMVAESVDDLKDKLTTAKEILENPPQSPFCKGGRGGVYYSQEDLAKGNKLAFLFPGQGSQRPNMLRDLTLSFAEVRQAFARADEVLEERLPKRLSEFIFPAPSATPQEENERLQELTRTNVAQPALGAAEMGLGHLLNSFGVVPDMLAGHSSGEYAALAAAGVFTEEDLYDVLEYRGASIIATAESGLTANQKLGTMLAVAAAPVEIEKFVKDVPGVYLANLNSPRQTVLSGTEEILKEVSDRLGSAGIKSRFIPVSAGFHSPYVMAARDRLAQKLSSLTLKKPSIPVYSNSLAAPYPTEAKAILACLIEHLIHPVRFTSEIERMYQDGGRIFVEVGPRNVLTGLVNQILGDKPHLAVACNTGTGKNEAIQFLQALGQLFTAGVDLKAERLFSKENQGDDKLSFPESRD